MLKGGDRVWSAVRHVRVELEGGVVGFVGSGESNAFRSRRATSNDVEVEAVQVNLNLTFKCLLFELLHVSVQCDELGSQDIVAWFDVAGQLDFEAVAIIGSKFVGPSIYSACQSTANR